MINANLNEIKKIVHTISDVPIDQINEDTALVEDLQLSSLKFIELMAIIGEEYGVSIEENDAMNLQTVGHLYNLLNSVQS